MNPPASSPDIPPDQTGGATAVSRGAGTAHGGLIVRQAEPVNLEMPFGSLDGFITEGLSSNLPAGLGVQAALSLPEGEEQKTIECTVRLSLHEDRTRSVTVLTGTIDKVGHGDIGSGRVGTFTAEANPVGEPPETSR